MFHFPLKLQPMQESGGALLRAIQNDSMNLLDLLVRESVQNSLDAALKKFDAVRVNFELRDHSTAAILEHFSEGLDSEKLAERFRKTERLLEIRDVNTESPLVC